MQWQQDSYHVEASLSFFVILYLTIKLQAPTNLFFSSFALLILVKLAARTELFIMFLLLNVHFVFANF